MTSQPENLLVGLVALALLPFIGWRILRGLRDGRLPLYRTYVNRGDDRAKFGALLVLHALSLAIIALVAGDLLLNLGIRDRL